MGNPFDAEDLTQDVFLSAYKNLSRFDGTYEKAWLSKIAVHKCLDHLKAAGRRTIPTEDTYFEQLHDKESSPEEAFLDKDFQNQIRHLCSDLKSPDANLPCKIHAEGTAGKERLDAYTTG